MRSSLLFIAMAFSVPASAEQIIRCDKIGSSPVTIMLSADRKFGAEMNCIDGYFTEDLTPCAPNRGLGLSNPLGRHELIGLAWEWQDYDQHRGGVAGSSVSATSLTLHGGKYEGDGLWTDLYVFHVDRITGVGQLRLSKKRPDGRIIPTTGDDLEEVGKYECRAADRKF